MLFLAELTEEVQYITEDDGKGGKRLFVEGIACAANVKNKNNRIYPKHILQNEISRYQKESIDTNTAVGELNHPATPNINLDRVSHKFISVREDGNNFIAKAKVLNTPCGQIAQQLINDGVTIGFSSRGLGSLKPDRNGLQEVQSNFKLSVLSDFVANPSAPSAWCQGIMENTEWYFNVSKGTWMEKQFQPLVESMNKLSTRQLNEKKFKLFEYYLNGISKK